MTEKEREIIEKTKNKIACDLHDSGVMVNKSKMELSEFKDKVAEYQKKYSDFRIKYVMYNDFLINNIEVLYRGPEWGNYGGIQWICMSHAVMLQHGLEHYYRIEYGFGEDFQTVKDWKTTDKLQCIGSTSAENAARWAAEYFKLKNALLVVYELFKNGEFDRSKGEKFSFISE